MITTKVVLAVLGSGGFCATSFLLVQDKLDLVERYGLLGLHAMVVLGIGTGMLKIGWEQVKTSRKIELALASLLRKLNDEHKEESHERDKMLSDVRDVVHDARDVVKESVQDSRDQVLAHLRAAFHRPGPA